MVGHCQGDEVINMFELLQGKMLCSHCRQPVTKNDLVMWVEDVEISEVFLVHRTVTNPKCDPAITKFLNDLYPEHHEQTLHIVNFFQIAEEDIK